MFTEDEVKQLQALFETLNVPVEFILHGAGESEFGRKLENCVSEICSLSNGKCILGSDAPDTAPDTH